MTDRFQSMLATSMNCVIPFECVDDNILEQVMNHYLLYELISQGSVVHLSSKEISYKQVVESYIEFILGRKSKLSPPEKLAIAAALDSKIDLNLNKGINSIKEFKRAIEYNQNFYGEKRIIISNIDEWAKGWDTRVDLVMILRELSRLAGVHKKTIFLGTRYDLSGLMRFPHYVRMDDGVDLDSIFSRNEQ